MSMLSRRARSGLLLAAVAAAATVYALAVFEIENSGEARCNALKAIATDAKKMQYVREWVAARTRDRQFMDAMLKYPRFEAGFPNTLQYIDIDWRYLGFDPRSAWVAFNIDDAGEPVADPAKIVSVSLNQGRSGIIIRLKADGDLVGRFGPPGDASAVKPVGDDVFMYCDYSD